MNYKPLGNTSIEVSSLCLGSMTWGHQNDEADAFAQIDYALEQGINFVDTAEMYSVPTQANTYGATEKIIGRWLATRKQRDKVIIASKVAGPSRIKHIRDGKACLDRDNIHQAIDGSLQRLQTDYIDLYQLHWPDRKTNFFGQLNYQAPSAMDAAASTPIEETLSALAELVTAGKVRAIGLSNETPWGVMQFLQLAERLALPRVVSIQNPYNLLNRSFELALAEIAHHEQVGLLAYSPLAFGCLTGKYLNPKQAQGARCSLFKEFKRYFTPSAVAATQKYVALAHDIGLTPVQLALSFIQQQTFLNSTIIGATSMQQLKENVACQNIKLSKDTLKAIETIHAEHTYPAP